ncbi:hypothetical protein PXH69_33860 [Rhodococcus qingshengii]|uniref:PD-(D/E)XK motif protein n=1 Tax=Rhodococcus qingshengii TaxID=334542 RepID=A0AAW6LS08_RHOSG|nr:hypothetical protein [Rhodococcus qingshengii]MDE8649953.1 hypothetical protein [Rhodococcus qingshengii]
MTMTRVPQMFTKEVHATRALGAALHQNPDFALSWLGRFGIQASEILSIDVEHEYLGPETQKLRRADIYLEFTQGCAGSSEKRCLVVEAKVEALVDDEQLIDAGTYADWALSLIPHGIPKPTISGALVETWEALITRMHDTGDPVLAFVATQFDLIVNSDKVQRRRRLAMLVSQVSVPPGWELCENNSSKGGLLSTFWGPARGERHVHIEVSNEYRGREIAPRAKVLVCSSTSHIDPVVIEVLRDTVLPTTHSTRVGYRTNSGARDAETRSALDKAGVPKWRTHGFGEKQLAYGWSGYGPVVELRSEDHMPVDIEEWLRLAFESGIAFDAALAAEM